MTDFATRISQYSPGRLKLLCTELKARVDQLENARPEPVAIVGMACRFPGARDLESFWELLHNGVDAIGETPFDRWPVENFYDPDPNAPGKIYCKQGGFLDDIDRFDPSFFNISPREALSLDPQYRLLLEVTWQALEDAGQNPLELRGSRTGVFIGVGTDDYAKIQIRSCEPESITTYTGTGNAYCYGVGRLSYFLGLQGPNFPIDTACSSSLVVTHLGCQSLRARECDLALAGGVHLMLSPVGTIFLCRSRALSPDGRCKTFDAQADGFVRGEGCGVIVLKRLSDALASGDRIYALIRGSAVNHDGPSSGFTVPNGPAQQAVIQETLNAAAAKATDLDYVEAHGTGTSLGDPIEVRSIAAVLGRKAGRASDKPLILGSVKTNFGHLESAAGIAGLIKTALSLQHEEIPPHLHLKKVNPNIALEDGPFVVPKEPLPWLRSDQPRLAGVSSFGLSGTNAHIILQEAPPDREKINSSGRPLHVLTLSARTESALKTLAGRFHSHLSRISADCADVCFTTNTGRAHFAHRLAVVGGTPAELQEGLKAFPRKNEFLGVVTGRASIGKRSKVAFLFSGEGSHYAGMGQQLYSGEPRFREVIQRCEEAVGSALEFPLARIFQSDDDCSQALGRLSCAHAALVALELGLVELWRSWGIEPVSVLGHGLGEYVAAAVAGVLTPDDALRLVVERARLAESLLPGWQTAAVTAEEKDLSTILSTLPPEVLVTGIISHQSVIVSGPKKPVVDLARKLQKDQVKVWLMPGGSALYGPAAAPLADRIQSLASRIRFQSPKIPMASTLTGQWIESEIDWPHHLGAHSSSPVRFAAAMGLLMEKDFSSFLEIGPKATWIGWGKESLPGDALSWNASLRPDEDWNQMLSSLSHFYVGGAAVDWRSFDAPYSRRKTSLPTYPFERQRYWLDIPQEGRSSLLISEEDALKDGAMRSTIEKLLRTWGEDGSQAFNRRVTAPLVFFPSNGQGFFFLNQNGPVLLVQVFVGPPECFEPAVQEISRYAHSQGLNLIFLTSEARADKLQKLGFSTTPVGVWQATPGLESFDIQAKEMRRLRSKYNSYRNRIDCSTREYQLGSDSEVDRQIIDMMEHWVTRKKKRAPFVSLLKQEVLAGKLDPKYRIFLTRREGSIDSVILLAPIEAKNGYLLDLEFYTDQMPSGCLEYSIVNTMEQLKSEGITYYSLGSTFGIRMDSDPHEDPRIREILESFHREGILNDDGILDFKKKFDPTTGRMYICCLPEADISVLSDVLLMLAVPERIRPRKQDPLAAIAGHGQSGGTANRRPPQDEPEAETAEHEDFHPLLSRRVPLALDDAVFESRLQSISSRSSWLADHRVLDTAVVPAAAYIEMAIAAAKTVLHSEDPILEDLSVVEALPLHQQRIVQLVFSVFPDGTGLFRISSRKSGAGPADGLQWNLHATGKVRRVQDASSQDNGHLPSSIEAHVANNGLKAGEAELYYQQVEQFGLKYGPAFRTIQELSCSYGEAFARVQLPDQLLADLKKYQIHPVLLDACLQVQGAALLASQREATAPGIYLPVAIESVRVTGRPGANLFVHCSLRPVEGQDAELIAGDLQVLDEDKNIVASLEGLAVRRTSREVLQLLLKGRPKEVFHELEWRRQPRQLPTAQGNAEEGQWMIFADDAGIAEQLKKLAQERGERCLTVYPGEKFDCSNVDCWYLNPAEPEQFRHLFNGVQVPLRVAYLWPAEPPSAKDLDVASLRRAQVLGSEGLLHLVQALAQSGSSRSSVWLVTRATQGVGVSAGISNPCQAPVWGLGRTVALEHPEIWGGMIDLDAAPSAFDAKIVLEEIVDSEGEDHIAFRDGQRHVARLVAKEFDKRIPPVQLRSDATYAITGGVGGLGLATARWMVTRGAQHLLLIGRKTLSPEIQLVLDQLQTMGAKRAVYYRADVSNEEEVAGFLAFARENLPPLRGVIHAAGTLADASLIQQSWSRFLDVMAAKVEGAWHLHHLTKNLNLDHFVLFSSTASIFGAPGQGNYAAANTFMDALAQYRRVQGLPALSINWGPWADVGMSASLDSRAVAQRLAHGLTPITPADGVRLLEQAMAGSRAQIGIVSVDWEKMLKSFSLALQRSSIFKEVVARVSGGAGETTKRSVLVEELRQAPPEKRRSLFDAYVIERVAKVLGADPANVSLEESLTSQGFDSLMALELRERVEAELGITIPILVFFRSNSLNDLGNFLFDEVTRNFFDTASSSVGDSPQELLAKLDHLSDKEVDAALRRELENQTVRSS